MSNYHNCFKLYISALHWILIKVNMEALGIKFAPINVPLKRRIETLCALLWIALLTLGSFVGITLVTYLLIFTNYYPLAMAYVIWIYLDRETGHTGGRRIDCLRKLKCWSHFKDFFPLKLVQTCPLPNDRNYLFCVYPHGLLSAGAFGHFATDATEFGNLFPGLKTYLATLDVHFNTPIIRELLLSLGSVAASKQSIQYVLNSKEKGNVLVLVVGGAAEALFAHPGEYKIVLKNRRGFVKLALKSGCPLVPVFSFGENDLFDQVSNPPGSLLYAVQTWIKKYTGIAPCIAIGRGILQYSFGPVPRRCPVTTVIGAPIEVPHEPNPSTELIEKYHSIFTESITNLFEEHKRNFIKDFEKVNLIIE